MINIRGTDTKVPGQHDWVLGAARLKRIYLRLLSHFSFALGHDPSRLPIPDLNLVARKVPGFEVHWLRLMAPVFFALSQSETGHKRRISENPLLNLWIQQIEARLSNSLQVIEPSPPAPRRTSMYPTLEEAPRRNPSGAQERHFKEKIKGIEEGHREEVESLIEQITRLQQKNKDLEIIVDQLQKQEHESGGLEVKRLEADLDEALATISVKDQQLTELRNELQRVKETVPATDMNCIEEIAVLEIELDTVKSKLSQEIAKRQQLESQLDAQNYLFSNNNGHSSGGMPSEPDIDAEVERLQHKLEQLSRTKGELDIKYAAKKEKLAQVMAENEELKTRLSELSNVDDENLVVKENITAMEKMIESLDMELVKSQEMLQESADRVKELEVELDQKRDQEETIFNLTSKLARSEAELEELKTMNTVLNEKHKVKDRKVADLEEVNYGLEEELSTLQLHSISGEETLKAKIEQIINSKTELNKNLSDNQAHLEKLEQIQSKIDQVTDSLDLDAIEDKMVSLHKQLKETILSKSDQLQDIAEENKNRLENLNQLQESIDRTLDQFEPDRIIPLTERIDYLENLLNQIQHSIKSLKQEKKPLPINNLSEEHKMILAAWHDLGVKIMKLK